MNRFPIAHGVAASVVAITAVAGAAAATMTHVSFAGRDDTIPKLGLPAIAVSVSAGHPADVRALGDELTRALARTVHTRPLARGDAADYDLIVLVEPGRLDGSVTVVPFQAFLYSPESERLWRVEGRSEVADTPVDASVFVGIGRNVVAALIHDGWVSPRQDPDDPPPQAPSVRLENGR